MDGHRRGAAAALCGLLAGVASVALAGPPEQGPGLYYVEWKERNDRSAEPEPREFTFINYFFTRATWTNQLADPAGLKGVSLGPIAIGEAGSATRVGEDTGTFYVEQRWIPVVAYSPLFADGLATFRAQFEIDFMWGQAANQLQHNQGGGLNADQVNLQTKNVNAALYPTRRPGELSIVVGTQSLYDSVYDPAITPLWDIVRTGYKLAFLGTDGTGLAVYSRLGGRWKLSFVPIGVAQPHKATKDDPAFAYVYLLTADYGLELAPGTFVGASLWHLRDDTEGDAFAYEGLVKSGPGSDGLFPYTGVPDLAIEQPTGHVTWAGLNFHHNVHFRTGDWAASGFVMLNAGRYESRKDGTRLNEALDILGLAANLELAYNYGRTPGDVVTLEAMYASGDDNLKDGEYTGAFTLNNYGLPGAVWFNHKTLILFPFTGTVSNYTGSVTDISNRGYGLQAGILSIARDLVPNKLNLKLGAAYAQSGVAPPDSPDGYPRGRTLGAEVNAELRYHIRYLMTVGLHAGYLFPGSFYDANPAMDANPFATFATFTWYGF